MNQDEKSAPEQQPAAPPQQPIQQQPTTPQQPSEQDAKTLKTARTFITLGNVMGPVSMIFGGVVVSSAALVVEIIAFFKLSKLIKSNSSVAQAASRLKRANIVGFVIALVALLLNIYALTIMYPLVLEAVQSGDYSNLLGSETMLSPNNAPNSTWG